MKIPHINWERLAPAGLDGKREAVWTAVGLGGSTLWALRPLFRLLQGWDYIREVEDAGGAAPMPMFYAIMGGALWGFAVTGLCLAALAVWHYVYHRQGSRSGYLMRRVPNRWEIHRRCLAIPLAGIVLAAALALGLRQLYWWLYITFTPPESLLDVSIVMVVTR